MTRAADPDPFRPAGAVPLLITGSLADDGFLDWIRHRAGVLDLQAEIRRLSPTAIRVTVAGPDPLIWAMEAACSLGPAGVLVEDIAREPRQ
ncbi:acylphosphatase [Mangrovicoccus algicola]|uniref:Acylphosphatase n=1 Tax=Mangrovicoccus algicola TaxID=2771008 RepID=A0A8J7D0W6_9RHOB|nr:acylphosphatase [Mangrovicoccus algicola]MBE3640048.1 acylphosphatase [Mangrovicoccus algicola]